MAKMLHIDNMSIEDEETINLIKKQIKKLT